MLGSVFLYRMPCPSIRLDTRCPLLYTEGSLQPVHPMVLLFMCNVVQYKTFVKRITPNWLSWLLSARRLSRGNVGELIPYSPPENSSNYLDYDCQMELKLKGKGSLLTNFVTSLFTRKPDVHVEHESENDPFDAQTFAFEAASRWAFEKYDKIKDLKRFGCNYQVSGKKHHIACDFAK
ncbi:hypothetical protein RB195_013099 [Necator americanus]|uniref:SCP domain-containing protein n=1 Tax=Necator americanus TaxID=51031 RepID=A0ABR1DU24_NECAM